MKVQSRRLGRRAKRRDAARDVEAAVTTAFFATDLHGSEVCFRKFVNAAEFYGAELLILGGDITGKFVVPIVEQADGNFRAELFGDEREVAADAVKQFERDMADRGLYAKRMTREERERCERDPEEVDRVFDEQMVARLVAWIEFAKEKLASTDIRILCAPGNDDPFFIDDVIREHGGDRVLLVEGELYEVAPGHQMLNTGYSNRTPWNTHRELDEPDLRARIDGIAAELDSPRSAIFNIHVPPYDCGIDTAPALDESLSVKTSAGAELSEPVGSTAVREALEHYQPLLSIHGHVHEADGAARIGDTIAMNAGSEYPDGRLRGILFSVGNGELVRHQATVG